MSDPNIGHILTTEEYRDAIHVAIAPVKAGQDLMPGDHVGIVGGVALRMRDGTLGVVDPFLRGAVISGQRFWLCLYPKTITSLRHNWTHPAFDGEAQPPAPVPVLTEVEKSKLWLTDIATRCGVSYQCMMDAVESDDYIHMGDNEHYRDVLDDKMDEFAKHCAIVLGKDVGHKYPFSCSC